MPVEFCLELMAVIGSNVFDSEGEFFDHIIDEINRAVLGMVIVYFQGSDARAVVNSSVLIPPELSALPVSKGQEFDIHLDMMPRHLFLVALEPSPRAFLNILRKPV